MGKTQLALEAAARQLEHFGDGVYFVPLASVATPEFLLEAIVQTLNLTLPNQDVLTQIIHYLRPYHLLLILDNFEHLMSAECLTLAAREPLPATMALPHRSAEPRWTDTIGVRCQVSGVKVRTDT